MDKFIIKVVKEGVLSYAGTCAPDCPLRLHTVNPCLAAWCGGYEKEDYDTQFTIRFKDGTTSDSVSLLAARSVCVCVCIYVHTCIHIIYMCVHVCVYGWDVLWSLGVYLH